MHTPFTRSTTSSPSDGRVSLAALAGAVAPGRRRPRRPDRSRSSRTPSFLTSPATALPLARALGARTVRVNDLVVPDVPEPRFDAQAHLQRLRTRMPYSAAKWAPYDALVNAARQQGLFGCLPGHRRCAPMGRGRARPRSTVATRITAGGRTPHMYGQFVHAVAPALRRQLSDRPAPKRRCRRCASGPSGTSRTSAPISDRRRPTGRPCRSRRRSIAGC